MHWRGCCAAHCIHEACLLCAVDGHWCSTRLQKLLGLGSTVLKDRSEIRMWYESALVPYVHYIPIGYNNQVQQPFASSCDPALLPTTVKARQAVACVLTDLLPCVDLRRQTFLTLSGF